ncbi:Plant protein of unknown function (DUF863 [Striga hermonthica]|uniref:Uncharacterized protein n=1 Tax=Striga hermonthica TaxID=68872 RepID=A0A9N7RBJ2_STRHE|nr:Plant protein of unknown function (DUF863 [Striga hermonthica]
MGTKIHCESYLPELYSMRDLNENSSISSWPFFCGDRNLPNGQHCNGFMPRGSVDGYPVHEKDALKQKMLEHEAVFKNQVFELHRLYQIQRDMMEEAKKKEPNRNRASMEPAASSSNLHNPREEAKKWHMAGFSLPNSSYCRTSIPGLEIVNSPTSCLRINTPQPGGKPLFENRPTSKVDSDGPRPSKVRKRLFDLRLPADEYIDIQEGVNSKECKESHVLGYNVRPECSTKLFIGGSGFKGSNGLADLNEPIIIDDDDDDDEGPSSVDFLGHAGTIKAKGIDRLNGFSINSSFESKVGTKGLLSHISEAGSSRGNNYYSPAQNRQPDKLFLPSHHGTNRNGCYHNREDVWRRDKPRQILESSIRNHNSSSYFTTSWAHPVPHWANPTSSSAQTSSTAFETRLKPLFSQRNNEAGSYNTSTSASKQVQVHPPLTGIDFFNNGSRIFSTGPPWAGPKKPVIDINSTPQDTNGESKPEEDCHLVPLPWLKPKPKPEPVTDSKVTSPEAHRAVNKILGIPIFGKSTPPEVNNVGGNERNNGLIDINIACEPDEQMGPDEPVTTSKRETSSNKGEFIRDRVIDLNSCLSDCEDYSPAPNNERKTASVKITLEIDLEVPVFLDSEEEDSSLLSKEHTQEHKLHSQLLQNTKNEPVKDEMLQNAAETIFAISSTGPQNDTRPEVSLSEAINWFVDAISACPDEKLRTEHFRAKKIDEFEAMTLELAETKEEDYMPKPFVLDIPKNEEENEANALAMRSRRGQTRRGRQRKDFQRDILPGLTTLSRNEVTEDLQIFGGLMRATGHSWNFGLTKRNGGGRGRRRAAANVAVETSCSSLLMKQIGNNNNNRVVEGGLEDQRLAGWGKTRRPRRQRCPAGNISTVVLT